MKDIIRILLIVVVSTLSFITIVNCDGYGQQAGPHAKLNFGLWVPPIVIKLPRLQLPPLTISAKIGQPNNNNNGYGGGGSYGGGSGGYQNDDAGYHSIGLNINQHSGYAGGDSYGGGGYAAASNSDGGYNNNNGGAQGNNDVKVQFTYPGSTKTDTDKYSTGGETYSAQSYGDDNAYASGGNSGYGGNGNNGNNGNNGYGNSGGGYGGAQMQYQPQAGAGYQANGYGNNNNNNYNQNNNQNNYGNGGGYDENARAYGAAPPRNAGGYNAEQAYGQQNFGQQSYGQQNAYSGTAQFSQPFSGGYGGQREGYASARRSTYDPRLIYQALEQAGYYRRS